jgi:hypothetical protein
MPPMVCSPSDSVLSPWGFSYSRRAALRMTSRTTGGASASQRLEVLRKTSARARICEGLLGAGFVLADQVALWEPQSTLQVGDGRGQRDFWHVRLQGGEGVAPNVSRETLDATRPTKRQVLPER